MEKWDACVFAVDTEELERRMCYSGLDLASTVLKCCIDAMSRLILKYGPDMLEKIGRKEIREADCEETGNVL